MEKEIMKMEEHYCSLDLEKDQACDVMEFSRTLRYPTIVRNREVVVELVLKMRFTRCNLGLRLGDPVFSTTLLPGETVKIASSDRRTRFSFDSESNLSYRSLQMSEEQYFMSSMRHFSQDSQAQQSGFSSNAHSWDFHGSAEGGLDILGFGASASTSGKYNSKSVSDYLNQQSYQAKVAESQSVEATRKAHSVSIGEVTSRQHTEGETTEHYESTTRSFSNANKCHAVTYLFYRLNKRQKVTFELTGIERRVVNEAAPVGLNLLPVAAAKLNLIAEDIPVTKAAKVNVEFAKANANLAGAQATNLAFIANPNLRALTVTEMKEALDKVDKELIAEGILSPQRLVSEKLIAEIKFESESSLPTAGIIVKGYLDDCDTCEPHLKESLALDNDRKRLENEMLKRQIELLDKSKDYRCCADELKAEVPAGGGV